MSCFMIHKLIKYILIDKNSLNTFSHQRGRIVYCHGTHLLF